MSNAYRILFLDIREHNLPSFTLEIPDDEISQIANKKTYTLSADKDAMRALRKEALMCLFLLYPLIREAS